MNKEEKKIGPELLNKTFAYLEGQPYRDVKLLLDEWYEVMGQQPEQPDIKPKEQPDA